MPNFPTLKRWMLFVDGENFTIRGQELLSQEGISPIEGDYWQKDRYIWLPNSCPISPHSSLSSQLEWHAIRAYYYTSVVGDDQAIDDVCRRLWRTQFTPRVFKKAKRDQKAKGVDISLTKDMLSHAFNDHYDVGILLAGDGDYTPLVDELKHLGKRIIVQFFSESAGLNPILKLASDAYIDRTQEFISAWKDPALRALLTPKTPTAQRP